jgi:hypothetical protein
MRPALNLGLLAALGAIAAGSPGFAAAPGLGANACSSSGCHGGAGEHSRQFVVWSQSDVHSRSYSTLTSSRAARMAEALSIRDPVTSPRCTVCHAPLSLATAAARGPGVEPSEGVSCVSCHDVPAAWLRSHTRLDWGHAERVAAGMRDLRDLYGRANACVACHQNIETALVAVGRHPALIFELDGQTQDEPKHWSERPDFRGAQAWFVGQAVALREAAWFRLNSGADFPGSDGTIKGIAWVLARSGLGSLGLVPDAADRSPEGLAASVERSDLLAKRAAQAWEPGFGLAALKRLSSTQDDFLAQGTPPREQAGRAERLVMALDRLLADLPDEGRRKAASAALDRLFALSQSEEDFAPARFAHELDGFRSALGAGP